MISAKKALIFIFICLFIFGIRAGSMSVPVLDFDEAAHLYMATDILDGGVPYVTAWDNKGPLLYFLLVPVLRFAAGSVFTNGPDDAFREKEHHQNKQDPQYQMPSLHECM